MIFKLHDFFKILMSIISLRNTVDHIIKLLDSVLKLQGILLQAFILLFKLILCLLHGILLRFDLFILFPEHFNILPQ